MSDTHSAESPDTFDAEFETAREAEGDELDTSAEVGAGEGEGAEGGGAADAQTRPEMDLPTATKRLGDTQAALKRERQERRQLAKQVDELRAKVEAPAAAKTGEAPEGMPDPNSDPIGALEWLKKRVEADEATTAEQRRANEARQQNAVAFKRLQQGMAEYENDFRELHADYDDAADHFAKTRREELAEQGFDGPELDKALADDLTRVVARALQAQKDPAEIVYNLAKRRGFGTTVKNTVDNSATRLQKIAEGQKAAKSVGTGGEGSGGDNVTYSSVSNLRGAAFDSAFEKLRARERRAG